MPGQPRRQGILPYDVQVTEKVGHMTARGGLPLVVETMRGLGLERAITEHLHSPRASTGPNRT
jgi:hypothetical protein